jgi:AraC-like DNA-binding protein
LLLCLLFEGTDGAATKAVEVPHYNKLTQLRHDIYQYPAESWFIQDICDNLGISRPYFHKLYVAAFGTTCTQDVIASRISYSKELLEETEESISFISQQCGFESDVYFMRKFKQHVGMTPTAYRRIYKKSTVTVKNSTEKKRR